MKDNHVLHKIDLFVTRLPPEANLGVRKEVPRSMLKPLVYGEEKSGTVLQSMLIQQTNQPGSLAQTHIHAVHRRSLLDPHLSLRHVILRHFIFQHLRETYSFFLVTESPIIVPSVTWDVKVAQDARQSSSTEVDLPASKDGYVSKAGEHHEHTKRVRRR